MTILFNRSKQKATRRLLRVNQTSAEAILWKHLRNRQLSGIKFKRQYGVGRYILDFYCPEKRIGIEIDGSVHGSEERKRYDAERQRYIEACKIKVIRFNNNQVIKNPGGVMAYILEAVSK